MLLFLHGSGKKDRDYVLALGPLFETGIQKRHLPFLIVAPQLPMFGRDAIDDYLMDRDPDELPRRLERGVPPRRDGSRRLRRPITGARSNPKLPYGPTGLPGG